MTITTLLRYFFGHRQAILDIAATRSTPLLGLLFVLSSGFAREYDGEDLLHEPWHIFVPVAASVTTSLILFLLVRWAQMFPKRIPIGQHLTVLS